MTWLNGSEVESLAMLRCAVVTAKAGHLDMDRMKRGLGSQGARDLADLIISGSKPPPNSDQERMLAAVDVVAEAR